MLHSEAKPIRKLTPSRLSNKNSFENQFVSLKDSVNTALQAVYKMPPRVPIDLFPKKKHPFRNVQLEPLNNKNMNNSLSNISQRGKRDINSSHTEPTSLNTLKTEEVTPMKDHQGFFLIKLF